MLYATYDIGQSYRENYDQGPCVNFAIPQKIQLKPIKLWNFTINSPLGVAAGPLLNAKYIDLYARLGFDIPVYKTVRTVERLAHPLPNCLMVNSAHQLRPKDIGQVIYPCEAEPNTLSDIAITNSFGIPSKPIELWQADIEKANRSLDAHQLMIVSCVGTPLENRSLIDDFVLCAQKAVEAGAKAIELNYSCPNVISKEGSIYQDPLLSSAISKQVKYAIKDTPLIIKIGYMPSDQATEKVIQANAPFIDGIASVNTISMQVRNKDNTQALPGKGRLNSGICGCIIKDLALEMTERIVRIRQQQGFDFVVFGTGGVVDSRDIDDYLNSGADVVMSATGSMWNPFLAHDWQKSQLCD